VIVDMLVALVLIAIVCVIAQAFLQLVPVPAPVKTIVWAFATIICLLILLAVFTGGLDTGSLRLDVD
jgi:hypothetical protein